jgi:membrane protease YdiL (CAAX protease family)
VSRLGFFDLLAASFRGRQFKPTVVLLVSTLTLVTWTYFCSRVYYLEHLSDWFVLKNDPQLTATLYMFLGALVLLGLVPALVVKLVFREGLADYGVQLGDRVRTVRSFLLCAPVFVLVAYWTSLDPAYRAIYPFNPALRRDDFALHAAMYFLFYLGWEFHFRGFMQFGLRDSMGDASALWVQVLLSVVMHIGKPASETYGSIFGALLWGILAFRTRSLLSGALQHATLGICLDWFICSARQSW